MIEHPDCNYRAMLDSVGVCITDTAALEQFLGSPFTRLNNTDVQKVHVATFYTFAKWVEDLRQLKAGDSLEDQEVFRRIVALNIGILLYFNPATAQLGFPHTKDVVERFQAFMQKHTGPNPSVDDNLNSDGVLSADFIKVLNEYLTEFERFFVRESYTANIFAVTKKGIYDLTSLIENAAESLPETTLARISDDAKENINAAGRCLALDSPTACGFHLFRAVESLMRDYHFKLAGAPLKPQNRNWGAFIKLLVTHGADAKVTGYLTHIKNHYRNPLVHPEDNLTQDEAFALFGACISAVTMLDAAINP